VGSAFALFGRINFTGVAAVKTALPTLKYYLSHIGNSITQEQVNNVISECGITVAATTRKIRNTVFTPFYIYCASPKRRFYYYYNLIIIIFKNIFLLLFIS
jgi:hypothetical protein